MKGTLPWLVYWAYRIYAVHKKILGYLLVRKSIVVLTVSCSLDVKHLECRLSLFFQLSCIKMQERGGGLKRGGRSEGKKLF